LTEFSGCVSSRIASTVNDLPVSCEYYYFIHCKNVKYELENAIISDEILSGKIINHISSKAGNKIDFYIESDSVIKINAEGMLSIPVKDISDIEIVKVANGKTLLLVLGSFLGIILLIGILSFDIDPISI